MDTQRPHSRLVALTVAALLLVGIGSGLPNVADDAPTLLLVFPPWWSRADVWRAALATGEIVSDVSPFAVVLHSESGDLAGRARRAGAILVLDPRHLAACGSRPEGLAL